MFRWVSGEVFSRIEEEGVLRDVDPRRPASASGEQLREVDGRRESNWPNWRGGTGRTSFVQPGCIKPQISKEDSKKEVEKEMTGGDRTLRDYLLKLYQSRNG